MVSRTRGLPCADHPAFDRYRYLLLSIESWVSSAETALGIQGVLFHALIFSFFSEKLITVNTFIVIAMTHRWIHW